MEILVADDEDVLRRLLDRVLVKAGFRVSVASDVAEAELLMSPSSQPFAVALIDAKLPPTGAVPLLEMLRGRSDAPGVILISGAGLDPPLEGLMQELRGVFLHKPFPVGELLKTVRDQASGRGA